MKPAALILLAALALEAGTRAAAPQVREPFAGGWRRTRLSWAQACRLARSGQLGPGPVSTYPFSCR